MSLEEDDDDIEIDKLTPAEKERLFLDSFRKMPIEDQGAMRHMMEWLATDCPDDAAPKSREEVKKIFEDIKRERARRRLGGKVGQILPFKKPEKKE